MINHRIGHETYDHGSSLDKIGQETNKLEASEAKAKQLQGCARLKWMTAPVESWVHDKRPENTVQQKRNRHDKSMPSCSKRQILLFWPALTAWLSLPRPALTV